MVSESAWEMRMIAKCHHVTITVFTATVVVVHITAAAAATKLQHKIIYGFPRKLIARKHTFFVQRPKLEEQLERRLRRVAVLEMQKGFCWMSNTSRKMQTKSISYCQMSRPGRDGGRGGVTSKTNWSNWPALRNFLYLYLLHVTTVANCNYR